mgnify:CR=1 FL=1
MTATAPLTKTSEIGKAASYFFSYLKGRLLHTNLQLLYDCNFRCEICDFWKDKDLHEQKLSIEQIELISDKLAQVGPQIVSIGGGEPLMHPQILDVVRALARHHFPVMICNGWFVTPEKARALFEAGMYEVSVSIDYDDAAKHDKQRGKEGAFEKGLAALKILHDNRVNPFQRVHMISVIMDDNLDDIERLILRCKDMGITYLVTLYSDGRGSKQCRATSPDTSARLLELKKKYPEFVALRGYIGRFTKAIEEGGLGPCYAGKNLCNIDSQGNVSMCIDRKDDCAGNILKDDIEDIVALLLRKYHDNDCHACWTSCRGSIESLMYFGDRLGNAYDYYQMTKPVWVGKNFS